MDKATRIVLAFLMVAIMVTPIAASAMPSGGQYKQYANNVWLEKFHPSLLSKVLSGEISDNDVVTVAFRLEPLPPYTAAMVKGDHEKAINALKTWASITQAPFIAEVYKHGGKVVNKFWIDNIVLVRAKLSVIKELAAYPSVVKVLENFRVHIIDPVNKKTLNVKPGQQVESWGIFKIDAPGAWQMGYAGEGVRIAILDTGVDITHPALQGKMLTIDPTSPYYPGGWMEFDQNGTPVLSQPHDTQGHGTHTSGTALGGDMQNILIGVAPHATLMHALILPGGSGTFAQVLAGIQWAVDPFYLDPSTGQPVPTNLPAHVISMSLGASGYYGDDLFPGIEAALLANIIVVAAIGNDGQGTSSNPGNIWGVFGVGATDQNDQVAWFSSGEVVNWPNPPASWPFYGYYPSQYIKPDFSAPGVGITSSVPGGGYATWDGTSMATPHVAGTVALILQATGWNDEPVQDTPEKVYEILKNASVDLGDPGQDTKYGWGRINASQAVSIALQYAKKTGVQGQVLDIVDNSPVKWAEIHVQETGKTYGVRPDGTFKIPLDPGTYHLNFTAWGYYSKTVVVNVTVENGTISGFVYDQVTSQPIQGAAVTIVEANKTVYTDANGFFQAQVPAGTYTLNVTASGYYPYTTSVSVGENETVVVNIYLTPKGYGTVKGYVIDASTLQPIQNALVVIDKNVNLSAVTDSNGFYMIANVPAGMHTIEAYAQGYTRGEANFTIAPNQTLVINFTLTSIPPSVVVVGNKYGHVYEILNQTYGNEILVLNYTSVEQLLNDWINGLINPVTIVIDHWYSNTSYPSWGILMTFLLAVNATGVPVIFLDTPYSGATGMKALWYYYDNVTALGFLAPGDYTSHYPSADKVKIHMLDPNNPIFKNVVPDNDSWFYLANISQSSYTDYMVFVGWNQPVSWVGNISDSYNNVNMSAIGYWTSPGGSLWVILSGWAESFYMQYLVPGGDGMYSKNTGTVLVNAVNVTLTYFFGGSHPIKPGFVKAAALEPALRLRPEKYTNITVYLNRLPYGYVEATLVGSDGAILSNATVKVEGTPVETTTNGSGYFKIWLPKGNYTLELYKPGYAKTYLNITVKANQTLNLGRVTLKRVPRIAILYDYNGELKALIESKLGWYAEDFEDPVAFADAINSTMFDAAIWAGHYFAPFPSLDQFNKIMAAINATGKNVIFMDQWSSPSYPDIFGYGIRALSEYTGDPSTRNVDDYYGDIYIQITQTSPIFKGYKVGDIVKIINYNTQGYGTDYAAFSGFSGQTVAKLLLGGSEVAGDAVGVKVLPNGAKLVLMASWAPEEYQDVYWWTDDMVNIFLNAVVWVASKPVNVTPSMVEAYVGDTVSFQISGAPANYTFTVSLDGTQLGTITTNANGIASYTLTVPVIPGGTHLIYLEGEDQAYYGEATLVVKAKIVLSSSSATVPASVGYNATGLPANAIVHIYVDGNYLGTTMSSENGVASGVINLPFLNTGEHYVKVVSANYTVLAKAEFQATNSLGTVSGSLGNLLSTLSKMNATLQAIVDQGGKIYALINTSSGQIIAELGNATSLVNAKYSDLESLIKSVNGTLAGLIKSESGDIYALINTSSGQIIAKINDSTNSIIQQIQNLQSSINASLSTVSKQANSAKSRANAGVAVGSIALIAGLAGIATIFRRP